MVDTIPALVWCTLPDGSNQFHNQRWHDYTGLPEGAETAWGWRVAYHPEDLERLLNEFQSIVASGAPGEMEARMRRFDGEYRWFLIRAVPFRDETGTIIYWYGSSTDIEDRKRAEEKLRQDERELRRITDAIPQMIFVHDATGTPLYANQAVLDYTGLTVEDVTTSEFPARIFHPEDIEKVREEHMAAVSRGVPFEIEKRARRKDGQYRWFLIRFNPFHDEQGRPVRWYGTGTDVEDRKRAEERTRNENVALREEIDRSSMFEEIVGASAVLRRCWRRSRKSLRLIPPCSSRVKPGPERN
ncbi:PAS domain-containing protein [Candidatus Binatus sp.]|uniref:PAS domain-containing protein n=1 Tax=Candidatus Binatus sp. TaxID=2811406 RepID=UPI003CC6028A